VPRRSDLRSVCVVGGRRLTAGELLRSHERAGAYGVRLTMDATGAVTLRPWHQSAEDGAARLPQRSRSLLLLPRMVLRRAEVTDVGLTGRG